MQKFLESAQAMKDELIRFRRTLHQNPEVGDHLPKTKAFVMDQLREFGYEPMEICESGIVALAGGKKPGKTFLLRADMDALPIHEETNYEFKADNGCMHACGHDLHTAMLLGAAKLLKQYEDEIEGTVKLVFQPNEEGFKGAKAMLKAGVLENPRVDAAMAMHVHSGTPSNVVLCGLGTSIAGCTIFRITVNGTGCHGAMPETGVDPINIAAHIYLSMQEITAREIAATESAVITIGKFKGGDTHNVIPDQVVMEGTIRYLSRDTGDFIFKRIGEIATATAQMFRGDVQVEQLAAVPPLTNDKELANEVAGYVKELVSEKAVVTFEGAGMGSEDFASFGYEVPSVYFLLGAGTKEENPLYGFPMHHPQVVFNEDILVTGAAMHAYGSIMWLKNHKQDHK
ncbi:M20 metallopeptidase family protein [Bacillus testis]|uniref:M20 metallopeptidase family protein n=1 Tax=Bacillus testis TaxID=1622072 RepID=UPI00067F1721|nr:M20 family metallopeptidase [Bacillus testis]